MICPTPQPFICSCWDPVQPVDWHQDNVRVQDRLRPSNEQQAAQKGTKRLEMLLESALRHVKVQAVLVCNLTGYVEELAVAAAGRMHLVTGLLSRVWFDAVKKCWELKDTFSIFFLSFAVHSRYSTCGWEELGLAKGGTWTCRSFFICQCTPLMGKTVWNMAKIVSQGNSLIDGSIESYWSRIWSLTYWASCGCRIPYDIFKYYTFTYIKIVIIHIMCFWQCKHIISRMPIYIKYVYVYIYICICI